MNAAASVAEYLGSLEPERRELVSTLREAIIENLDDGFEEMIEFGMLSYCVPLERFPDTYNGHPLMYAAIASQKRYASVYLMGCYSDQETEQWFRKEYEKTGLKPNMGKSCVRFRRLADVPFDLIGRAVARHSVTSFIELHERARHRS